MALNTLNFASKVAFLNGFAVTLPVATSDPVGGVVGDTYFNATSGTIRSYNGTMWVGVGGTPGGSNTAIQINESGSFGGNAAYIGTSIDYKRLLLNGATDDGVSALQLAGNLALQGTGNLLWSTDGVGNIGGSVIGRSSGTAAPSHTTVNRPNSIGFTNLIIGGDLDTPNDRIVMGNATAVPLTSGAAIYGFLDPSNQNNWGFGTLATDLNALTGRFDTGYWVNSILLSTFVRDGSFRLGSSTSNSNTPPAFANPAAGGNPSLTFSQDGAGTIGVGSTTATITLPSGFGGITWESAYFGSAGNSVTVAYTNDAASALQVYFNNANTQNLFAGDTFTDSTSGATGIVAGPDLSAVYYPDTTGFFYLSSHTGTISPGDTISTSSGFSGTVVNTTAGTEYVTVSGNNLVVHINSGVTTILTVFNAFTTFASALATSAAQNYNLPIPAWPIWNLIIHGDTIITTIAATPLAGGQDNVMMRPSDIYASNSINSGGSLSYGYERTTPLTGGSDTITNNISSLIIAPATPIAVYTVTMPPTPHNGQVLSISTSQVITTFALNGNAGQTVLGYTATTLSPNTPLSFQWVETDSSWYMV